MLRCFFRRRASADCSGANDYHAADAASVFWWLFLGGKCAMRRFLCTLTILPLVSLLVYCYLRDCRCSSSRRLAPAKQRQRKSRRLSATSFSPARLAAQALCRSGKHSQGSHKETLRSLSSPALPLASYGSQPGQRAAIPSMVAHT